MSLINQGKSEIYTGCGDQKTCFGYPVDCVENRNCSLVVAAQKSESTPDELVFEMEGLSTGYIAVGLSDDAKMVN